MATQVMGPCVKCREREAPMFELWGQMVPSMCALCSAASEREDRERERAMRVSMLMDRSGAPPKLRGWTLDSWPGDPGLSGSMCAWMNGYVNAGVRMSVYLHGPVGSGKTGLAWGTLRRLIEDDGVDGVFRNFRDLLAEMREAIGSGQPTSELRVRRARVLVLDDVGAERATEFAREQLAVLIEHRYQHQLPTIFTSNYRPRDLSARLGGSGPDADPVVGDRIVSRMMDGTMVLRVDGPDRRMA